jgi:hypothetical protein
MNSERMPAATLRAGAANPPSCCEAARERDYGAFLEVTDLGSPLITGGDVRGRAGEGPPGGSRA